MCASLNNLEEELSFNYKALRYKYALLYFKTQKVEAEPLKIAWTFSIGHFLFKANDLHFYYMSFGSAYHGPFIDTSV